MNRRLLILSTLTIPLLVAGCATKSIPFNKERAEKYKTPDEERTCKFTIQRESSLWGAGSDATVTIDEEWLASLWSGDEVTLYIKPGKHIVIVDIGIYSRTKMIDAKPNGEVKLFLAASMTNLELQLVK